MILKTLMYTITIGITHCTVGKAQQECDALCRPKSVPSKLPVCGEDLLKTFEYDMRAPFQKCHFPNLFILVITLKIMLPFILRVITKPPFRLRVTMFT